MLNRGLKAGLAAGVMMAGVAHACTVPVFRYALERWPPDPHLVIVASNAVSAEAAIADPGNANLWIERARQSQDIAARVFFPRSETAWYEGAWDKHLPTRLADSPLRRRIAHELLTGSTAVFVLLESSNAETNAALEVMLSQRLAALTEKIELPAELDYDDASDGWRGPGAGRDLSGVPLKIEFPMHRLSRDDVAERFLVHQLVGLRAGRDAPTDAVVAVVFGRGRTILLTGEELAPEIIDEVCWFLCGACSCRVKALNPGVDLLLTANWEDGVFLYPEPTVAVLPDGGEFRLGGTGTVDWAGQDASPPPVAAQSGDAKPESLPGAENNRQGLLLVSVGLVVIVLLVLLLRGRRS